MTRPKWVLMVDSAKGIVAAPPAGLLERDARRQKWAGFWHLVLFAAILAATGCALLVGSPWPVWLSVMIFCAVFVIVLMVAKLLVSVLTVDTDRRIITRRSFFVSEVQTSIESPRLHGAQFVGTRSRVWLFRIAYYAGGPRTMLAMRSAGDRREAQHDLINVLTLHSARHNDRKESHP